MNTSRSPMSVDDYKAVFRPAQLVKEALLVVGLFAIGLMGFRIVFARVTGTASPGWNEWIVVIAVVAIVIVTSTFLIRRQYRVDHEWHLYRGNILEVNTSDIVPGYVLVLFDGDEAYTRFTVDDYLEHEDILQEGKNLVLIARRSLEFGAPAYEAVVYTHR